MMYFLDFDRTLFDTDAFIDYLKTRSDTCALSYGDEMTLAGELNMLAEKEELHFADAELETFIYGDVREFLRSAGNEATIITYGNPALQKLKIANALRGIPRLSVFYTGDTRKGAYLTSRLAFYGESLLVDDTVAELEVAEQLCPNLRLFRMNRRGGEPEDRWDVITSLTELP